MNKRQIIFALSLIISLQSGAWAAVTDVLIKERKPYGKVIRTRMPPQILIETLQKEFDVMSPEWKTAWQNFVVEDDEDKDEFVVIARSFPKQWAFGLTKPDCPKPENYEQLTNDLNQGGTPLRMDALIGIRKTRSFFRYAVTVYEPIYDHWKNPCYEWNLAPGKSKDAFYKENYTARVYSANLAEQVYKSVNKFGGWKSPAKLMKIPAMKGAGQELIGADSEILTDEEKKLPVDEQEKILNKRRKENKKGRQAD